MGEGERDREREGGREGGVHKSDLLSLAGQFVVLFLVGVTI